MDKNNFDKVLGEILREKRQEKNYSMEYVAQRLGVTKMAVSYWETGKRSMYATTFRDYCEILGVSMQEVFDEMERKESHGRETHSEEED